mmetsp:Transcript_42103/g.49192  ORF Transcript_42103/g.49192 Transcript_42103/m.49192 type:complete len:435 (+) Transcript_42103:286-1590(+)
MAVSVMITILFMMLKSGSSLLQVKKYSPAYVISTSQICWRGATEEASRHNTWSSSQRKIKICSSISMSSRHQTQTTGMLLSNSWNKTPFHTAFTRHRRLSSKHFMSSQDQEAVGVTQQWNADSEVLTTITSSKNPTMKRIKMLLSKRKARTESSRTVLEGLRLVMDVCQLDLNNDAGTASQHVETVIVSELALNHPTQGLELKRVLLRLINQQHVTVCMATDEVIQSCSDTITSQGILAVCKIPANHTPDIYGADNYGGMYVVLDGLSDPGNVGTLLRTCVAVGDVKAVILLPGSCDVWNPKALRSAMSATFQIPIVSCASFGDCIDLLTECDVMTSRNFFAATMETSSESSMPQSSPAHYSIQWRPSVTDDKSSVALCIGSEGNGLSKEVRDAISNGSIQSVHVPMQNQMESLNAAVCGSVILFEYARQRDTK